MADVRTIQFTKIVKEVLYSDSEFIKTLTSHDGFVNNDKVQIPTGGTLPDVEEDRSSFPITVVERTDDSVEYDLIEFSLGAIRIPEKDMKELSYDKAKSIIIQATRKLRDRIGLRALYNLAQSTAAVETSGTAAAGLTPPSGTGNRQPLELLDLSDAAAKLDEDKVSQMNRYCILPSKVYRNFVHNNRAYLLNMDYNKNLANGDISNGVVSNVYGFKMIPRAYTCVYTSGGVLKAVGAAAAATDEWGIICYQADQACRALGNVKIYINKDDATYQADVISGTIRFNATKMYGTTETGIVTIKQDT
jgi:hypothetical protein